jgi:glycosyltransferase involved in cell wall biosynthesis
METGQPLNLSIICITKNEEKQIAQMISSLPQGSELIVVDSGSTDQTTAIATRMGAKVFRRDFTNYADQKNYALDQASRSWVFSIDADEVLTEDLKRALVKICQSNETKLLYRIPRQLEFMGKRLRFGRTTDYPLRLIPRGSARFVGEIHETLVPSDPHSRIFKLGTKAIIHRSYDDLNDYLAKLNQYTSQMTQKNRSLAKNPPGAYAVVLKPWLVFLNRYVLRCGFLDGYPGYVFAMLSSFYSFCKYAKQRE